MFPKRALLAIDLKGASNGQEGGVKKGKGRAPFYSALGKFLEIQPLHILLCPY